MEGWLYVPAAPAFSLRYGRTCPVGNLPAVDYANFIPLESDDVIILGLDRERHNGQAERLDQRRMSVDRVVRDHYY
jgi:hypothetical protein